MAATIEHMQAVATQRAEAAGNQLVDHIRQQMQAPKSGEVYTAAPGVTYVAAAAGEYPAVRSGVLEGSLDVQAGDGQAVVGSTASYAAEVERLRPFLSRAATEVDVDRVASEGWE